MTCTDTQQEHADRTLAAQHHVLDLAYATAEAAQRTIIRLRTALDMPPQEVGAPEGIREISKYLSPTNENVQQGDLIAAIRDLAQVAMGSKGLVEDLMDLVRKLEWEGDATASICPLCRRMQVQGHEERCEVGRVCA